MYLKNWYLLCQGNHTRTVASETGGWYTRTNLSLSLGPRDKLKNIQCHAVNQQIGETRVQSHTINVLCKFIP